MSNLSLNQLIETFGPDAGYVLEPAAEYRRAPDPLDASWRRVFESLLGLPPEQS